MPAIGDTLDTDEIMHLPIGAVVADVQGDTSEKLSDDNWQRNDGYQIKDTGPRGYFNNLFTPYTLASLPADPYQEARLALRDVLGMEPDEQMIRNTIALNKAQPDMGSTVNAARIVREGNVEPVPEAPRYILIVTALGEDTASRLAVSADTTDGLARLRAHSALDALLDQHGISR